MIEYNFIKELEGEELVGYVPDPEGSNSGVTISTGVDLSQTNIHSLSIDQELKDKLKPYTKIKGYDAIVFLVNNSLKLTPEESSQLSTAVYKQHEKRISDLWNRDGYVHWTGLCRGTKTVLFSVLYQYGSPSRVPNFWTAACANKWDKVIKELRNFGDRYPTRRNKEADYLENFV